MVGDVGYSHSARASEWRRHFPIELAPRRWKYFTKGA
jgi:hypothetical protein